MSINLKKAIEILRENSDCTCVLCKNEKIFKSSERGIGRLLNWVKSDIDFSGFSAADKIVGKAAAFIYVLLGVKEVYGEVMSEKAVRVFEEYNISYSYGILTKEIINRKGTGPCPMEETVGNVTDPKTAIELLEQKLASMK